MFSYYPPCCSPFLHTRTLYNFFDIHGSGEQQVTWGERQLENGFFGEAGLQPGILLSAKDKFGGETYSYRDWVNTFDFGIPIGVGYQFENNLGIGLRFIPGLANVNKGSEYVSRDRNFVVGLRAIYTLEKQ